MHWNLNLRPQRSCSCFCVCWQVPSWSRVLGFSGWSCFGEQQNPPSPPLRPGSTLPSPPPSAPWGLSQFAEVSVALCCFAGKDHKCYARMKPIETIQLTETHFVWRTWSMVSLSSGLVLRQPLISSFASSDTSAHSGFGNSYWPSLILFFIPGDIGRPWTE